MNSGDSPASGERRIEIKLIPAADDPPFKDESYQRELTEVERVLRSENPSVQSGAFIQKSMSGGSWLSGDFALIAQALGGVACTGLGAWVQAKFGRRVKLRIGEMEAEASTVEEVERLLEKANALKKRLDEEQ